MTLDEITEQAIKPALRIIGNPRMDSPQALVQMLTTASQESKLQARRQLIAVVRDGRKVIVPEGPAKGFWQNERGGGVAGTMRHPASKDYLQFLCQQRNVDFTSQAIWDAIETDDILAAGQSRLLYWTDPKPMPQIGDVEGAWQLYLRTWRPGAWYNGTPAKRLELRTEWTDHYQHVQEFVS